MLLNFPRCLSVLLLQISKTDNIALDIDASNFEKHNRIQHSFSTKLNAKVPWPPIMSNQRECILLKMQKRNVKLKETFVTTKRGLDRSSLP
jgi:hypothetical protein